MLQYDDSAFYFFALSLLSFYLFPCEFLFVDSSSGPDPALELLLSPPVFHFPDRLTTALVPPNSALRLNSMVRDHL